MEVEALRLLIREKLRDGRLPLDYISRFWGGPSDGEQCDACGEPVLEELVIEGITSTVGGKKPIQMHVLCFALWDEERREPREDDARRCIAAAIVRRKDEFTLSHLAWTANGYTVKFRQDIVDIVRTAVDGRVFEDPSRLDGMLDAVRLALQSLNPARRP